MQNCMMAAQAAKTPRKTLSFLQEDWKKELLGAEEYGGNIRKERTGERDPLILCMAGTRCGLTSQVHMHAQTESNITKPLKTELTLEPQTTESEAELLI